jgi:hypothetical protein
MILSLEGFWMTRYSHTDWMYMLISLMFFHFKIFNVVRNVPKRWDLKKWIHNRMVLISVAYYVTFLSSKKGSISITWKV